MRLNIVQPFKSFSTSQLLSEEPLPSLSVITGRNGAGKSQLLEGIHTNLIQPEPGYAYGTAPRLVTSVDLQSIIDSAAFLTRAQSIENARGTARQYRGESEGLGGYLAGMSVYTAAQVSSAEVAAGKRMGLWSDNDWVTFAPIERGGGDLFQFSVGEAFSIYNQAQTLNNFTQWRVQTQGAEGSFLTDTEFLALHGEPPWTVLSRALSLIGLPYFYETPVAAVALDHVEPRLVDSSSGRSVQPDELSSGERTLLQIAMSMYSVDRRLNAIARPAVILFDEPDAALHPSMVRSMVKLIQDELIDRLNVPVIMTTHSPTTVALVPQESLFLMHRDGSPRLQKVTTDVALKELLVGVPTISVDADNRRLVIVESPNDERRYTSIWTILSNRLASERSLQFTAAGSSSLPNGCDAVVDLVSRLRHNGNLRIWGLVDRDYRSSEPDPHVYFDDTRHSIENVVLDPLSLGLLLLRERVEPVITAMAGIGFVNFRPDEASSSRLIKVVTRSIFPDTESESFASLYVGGLNLDVNTVWAETRGHDLLNRVVAAFPQLKRYAHNDLLLDEIILGIWAERPEVVPASVEHLFERLLTD